MSSLSPAAAAAPNRLSVESGRAQGSRETNSAAMRYFNSFQQKRDEPAFDDLTAEDFAGPQSIQLCFHDWACELVECPPYYQGKPVDPSTIKNYYGLVKTRFQEDPRFKDHEDLQGDPLAWFATYRNDMVKELKDKINKGSVDGDYDDAEQQQGFAEFEKMVDLQMPMFGLLVGKGLNRHQRRCRHRRHQ